MYSSKIKSFTFFIIFTFLILSPLYCAYYDGNIEKNIFLSERYIYFHNDTLGLRQIGTMGFRAIYNKNNHYIIVGVNFVLSIDKAGNLLNKVDLPFYIDFSYMKNNKLYFGMKNFVYLLNDNFKTTKLKNISSYNKFYYKNGTVELINKDKKNKKTDFYFDKKTIYYKQKFYFPQSIERIFIFKEDLFTIDINGDVYFNGEPFLLDDHIKFIKSEKGHYYFFGDNVLDENKVLIKEKHIGPKGTIYKVFQKGKELLISTYENGIVQWDNKEFKIIYPYRLLSGLSKEGFIFRNGDIISNNRTIKINDEILKVKNGKLFGKDGVYDINSGEALFKKENFYFSDYDVQKRLICSYKKGLFLFRGNQYIPVKIPFKGIKEIFLGKYIIANDGIYLLKNKKLIIKGAVNSIYKKGNVIYFSLYKKGIFILKDTELVKTRFSIDELNAYFTENYIVAEMFHNIFIYNYEIFKK